MKITYSLNCPLGSEYGTISGCSESKSLMCVLRRVPSQGYRVPFLENWEIRHLQKACPSEL